ncbi:hypothetical protein HYW83_04885 [Candidatus Peregrinibacteria bacterium]|nr:hypothetical protein [Candidatus Peregrinibacteria bacterium]
MSHRPREDDATEGGALGRSRRGISRQNRPDDHVGVKEHVVYALRVIATEPDPDEAARELRRGKIRRGLKRVLVDGQLPPEE